MNDIHRVLIFVSFIIIFSLIQNSHAQQNQPFSIEILSPKEGDSFEKIVPIKWKSSVQNEELSYTVQLRLKESHPWLTLEKNYQGNSLDHKIPSSYAIKDGQIRIIATDGINEASTISGVFSANLNTGQDLTELDVRWDPFDKRWQAYVTETDGPAVFAENKSENVDLHSIPSDIIPIQNMNTEGMPLESIYIIRTLYFAKLVSMINESIQSLPDDAFFDSTYKADFQEILVSGDDNIYDLYIKSNIIYFDPRENINNFYVATTRLSEIKTRMDGSIGGNSSDDWILDPNSQNQILEKIDYALDEYLQSVGGDLKPVSIEDYDENWWSMIRMYQENAEGFLGYMCYSESLKKPPNNEHTQIHFEIPECQTFIPKSISPINQIRIGVPPEKIQCDEGLELIFKPSDGSPICVKPETKTKLIQRGWTSS